ncbi:DUF1868 domain-containing protein [Planktothrix sp. FACHB-1355]|uniref:DUF1868 domain-containing protein n=1 Tax=Aerosakkonema funiforme FACHB-1375 TaxID=2949571 RepID=A0A926VG31_9CYAN|nr:MULTISPECIES: DUF1868 domain-containing protein [Oscillatoriales]MBD2183045.1 DUF1868 domain-containing protein [Aerosakkonema funiforme FACHB-1375]MBD3557771.1 DUF1868 domain-containing protein [Planktothrix sp. FACHB-1355]
MDENYQTYLNRVARMMLPETYRTQVQYIQESPKFKPLPEGGFQAVSFPGYTTITPPSEEDSENIAFYTHLKDCQEQLLQELDPGLLVAVPPASFHLTLADLIWDGAYRDANENPDFQVQLRHTIGQIFQHSQPVVGGGIPIRWQLLGLMLMPRALAVYLLPADESSYDRIVKLRQAMYQNRDLIALGIEQQYHFTAHVTLAYFGEVSPDLDRDRLSTTLSQFNRRWLENPPELVVKRAELRKFDDMTRYYREADWPVLEF